MNTDRRDIAPLLLPFFPDMKGKTSEEWHFFLDSVCGLETPMDAPNGHAFDRWREKLAALGYPAFQYSAMDMTAMKDKAAKMLAAEQARAAALKTTLPELAKAAPNWPSADVLASTKG